MSAVPRGWVAASLRELCLSVKKGAPTARFRYIDISSIDNRLNRITNPSEVEPQSAPSRARQHVRAGDVLLSTVRTYLRNTAQVKEDLDGAIASTGFCVLRPGPAVSPRFLYYRCLENGFVNRLNALQTGSSYPAVRDSDVLDQEIALPPLAEQERIVAAIEEHFSRLDAARTTLAAVRRKAATLRHLVLESLVPETEKWVTTGDIAEVRGGIQKQPKRRPTSNRFPFLRVANVGRNELDLGEVHEVELFDGELERYRLEPGDLLVVEGNGSADQIGRSALWRGEIDDCVHQNHLIRVRPSADVDPRYLALYWNAPQTAARLREVASSTSGLYTLSTAKVKSIPVPIVTIEEQRAIVKRTEQQLSMIDAVLAAIDIAAARSEALRRSVLTEAFSGLLVAQDPNDEPASELLARIAAEQVNTPKPKRRQRT